MTDVALDLLEWQSTGPDKVADLSGFRFANEDERRQARALSDSRIVEFNEMHDGLRVSAKSHVGRIRIGTLTITIRPKVASEQLLTLFRYAYGFRDLKPYAVVGYSMAGNLFQDLVIDQLSAEVRILLERSIARAYVERHDNLSSPRGRINFGQLAAQGGVVAGTLPCQHFLRSSDHLLNQVVRAGLSLARAIALDRELSATIGRQERSLAEMASTITLSGSLLQQAHGRVNRLVAHYSSIIRLIEILYYGRFIELEEPEEALSLPGFLFDMNRFFQALLQRFLTENLPGFQVEAERGLTDMMRYVPGHNPRRRHAPRPRPDYAVKKGRKVVGLLDAKYRDLWERSLPSYILYQLSIYALSQPKGSTAAILYPTEAATARSSLIEIREPLSGGTAGYVALRPVCLSRLVDLIEDEGVNRDEARQTYALELAGLGDRAGRPAAATHISMA